MGLIKAIKNFRWGYLLISIILCAVGACFIAYPTQSMTVGSYTIGCASILVGIVLVVKVLANRKRSFSFAISVICAVLTVTCGVVALIIPEEVYALYPMFIGLFIVIDGSFKFQTVINAKRYNLKMWWFLLIFSVISIVGGFLTIRLRVDAESEKSIIAFSEIMGIALFADGLENFLSLFYLGRIVSRAKEAIEESIENKGDVYEDAVIADSYEIKDDDNIITVEILPSEKKELSEDKKEGLEDKVEDDNKIESDNKIEGESKNEAEQPSEKSNTKSLPAKSPYEMYSK